MMEVRVMNFYMFKKKIAEVINFPAYLYNRIVLWWGGVKYGKVKIYGRIRIKNKGKVEMGDDVIIMCSPRGNKLGAEIRTYFVTEKNAEIIIGNKVAMSNLVVYASNSVRIDDLVMIGGGVKIYDSDFHSIKFEDRMNYPDVNKKNAPIIIRKGAFIGAHTIILKGVVIGEEAVVGAGSVVTKDIPAKQIWAGNPARFIREIQ